MSGGGERAVLTFLMQSAMERDPLSIKQQIQLIDACLMAQSYLPHPNITLFALMRLVRDTSDMSCPSRSDFANKLRSFGLKYYSYGFKPYANPRIKNPVEFGKVAKRLLPYDVMGKTTYLIEVTEIGAVMFMMPMRGCKRYLLEGMTPEAEQNLWGCMQRVKAIRQNSY